MSNKSITSRQKLWFEAVQERVDFTSYVLGHMKEVKILGLSEKMEHLVQHRRSLELKISKGFRKAWALRAVLAHTPHSFIWLVSLGGYAVAVRNRGHERTPGVLDMATALSKVNLLIVPLGLVLNTTAQLIAALGFITGPTGCGKSTILKAIVGEAPILSGRIANNIHRVAFCDQVPWVSNGTIRDIIRGDLPIEESWYSTVISACALDVDLLQMPERDMTMVGSQAINLSGGQKQRIAIARALYPRKETVIFDDTLNDLDAVTLKHIVSHVFGREGLLRRQGTMTILATNSLNGT
ncbi:hypothetical protein N0V82_003064 [Gnomoniopsis sp. IMI 355080]|nr:hypothetical protein N0V82_003064 [Gnomoniopsis sp. IMI 355080]